MDMDFLQAVEHGDLVSFLELSSAWNHVDTNDKKWQVFFSNPEKTGIEIRLILPSDPSTSSYTNHLNHVIDTLSQVNDEEPDTTTLRVSRFNSDIVQVRNVKVEEDSIPLDLAVDQINQLKNLVKHSANQESKAVPFKKSNAYSSLASKAINEFRFGHTFRGSFGLRLESPLFDPKEQKSLFDDPKFSKGYRVQNRQIVERIMRGLSAAKQATKKNDSEIIVGSYMTALNANMGRAIIGISGDKKRAIEYNVLWSPIAEPSLDIAKTKAITLKGKTYRTIETASKKLQTLTKPETQKIYGMVLGGETDDDPNKDTTKHIVPIKWTRTDSGRTRKIFVELSADDYFSAQESHSRWDTISVEGEVVYRSGHFRLLNARNYKIEERGVRK